MPISPEDSELTTIVNQPIIKDHLSPDADAVYGGSYAFSGMANDEQNTVGSEHLVLGLLASDEAMDYMRSWGIEKESIFLLAKSLPVSKERPVPKSRESTAYRSIFSLAAALAHQENRLPYAAVIRQETDVAAYSIGGRHLVEAVRRTPASGAYKVLRGLTQNEAF